MSTISGKSVLKAEGLIILFVSVILNSLSLMYVHFMLSFAAVSLVLYLILKSYSGKHAFYLGALFGGISSLLLNYWMIPVVNNYAKGNIALGLACYAASAIVLACFFGVQFYVSVLLKYREDKRLSLIINALILASVWVFFEWSRAELFSAMPWLSYSLGITQGRSLYLIQPAAFGGVFILSFFLIVSAFFAASAYRTKNRKLYLIPVGIFVLQYGTGYALFKNTESITGNINRKKVSVALVIPGLSPDAVWTEESADGLVSHLFSLNKQAAAGKPDLILWTETVVPWTYSAEDDFVKELAADTRLASSHTLIGMNSAYTATGETLCNSVYLLSPGGKEQGRYDKQDLLTLVEKPLMSEKGGLILPFLNTYNLAMLSGSYKSPVETPWGKAGILICNESTNSALARELADKGAGFLINMGNNNWFSDHFITSQHFYNSRLRAVENRKDIIINNNMGLCGLVRASGEIFVQTDGKKSGFIPVEVYPNNLPVRNAAIFIYFITFILLFSTIDVLNLYHKRKQ